MLAYLKLIIIFAMLNQMHNIKNLKKYPIGIFAPKGADAVSIVQPFNNAKSGLFIMEIWKDIKGYERFYQISNLSKIRSLDRIIKHPVHGICLKKGGIMKQSKMNIGYMLITFCKNGITERFLVHRLVASHFISNPLNKSEVNHINSIRHDNSIENLEWVTHSENCCHAYRVGSRKSVRRKYSEHDIRTMFKYKTNGKTTTQIANIFNTKPCNISLILNRKSYKNILI